MCTHESPRICGRLLTPRMREREVNSVAVIDRTKGFYLDFKRRAYVVMHIAYIQGGFQLPVRLEEKLQLRGIDGQQRRHHASEHRRSTRTNALRYVRGSDQRRKWKQRLQITPLGKLGVRDSSRRSPEDFQIPELCRTLLVCHGEYLAILKTVSYRSHHHSLSDHVAMTMPEIDDPEGDFEKMGATTVLQREQALRRVKRRLSKASKNLQ